MAVAILVWNIRHNIQKLNGVTDLVLQYLVLQYKDVLCTTAKQLDDMSNMTNTVYYWCYKSSETVFCI